MTRLKVSLRFVDLIPGQYSKSDDQLKSASFPNHYTLSSIHYTLWSLTYTHRC